MKSQPSVFGLMEKAGVAGGHLTSFSRLEARKLHITLSHADRDPIRARSSHLMVTVSEGEVLRRSFKLPVRVVSALH